MSARPSRSSRFLQVSATQRRGRGARTSTISSSQGTSASCSTARHASSLPAISASSAAAITSATPTTAPKRQHYCSFTSRASTSTRKSSSTHNDEARSKARRARTRLQSVIAFHRRAQGQEKTVSIQLDHLYDRNRVLRRMKAKGSRIIVANAYMEALGGWVSVELDDGRTAWL